MVVLLFPSGQSLAFVKNEVYLIGHSTLSLTWLRDRRDELGATARVDDPLRRLAAGVQLPVPPGILVRRVEDGLFEELVIHLREFCAERYATVGPDEVDITGTRLAALATLSEQLIIRFVTVEVAAQ